MTRDAALAWIRAHETDSNEEAAQALLALLDEETSVLRDYYRSRIDELRQPATVPLGGSPPWTIFAETSPRKCKKVPDGVVEEVVRSVNAGTMTVEQALSVFSIMNCQICHEARFI